MLLTLYHFADSWVLLMNSESSTEAPEMAALLKVEVAWKTYYPIFSIPSTKMKISGDALAKWKQTSDVPNVRDCTLAVIPYIPNISLTSRLTGVPEVLGLVSEKSCAEESHDTLAENHARC